MHEFGAWDSKFLASVGTVVIVLAALFGMRACSYSECSEICQSNGDRADWTWTQGCYCRDDSGVYNPKDSRDTAR